MVAEGYLQLPLLISKITVPISKLSSKRIFEKINQIFQPSLTQNLKDTFY